MDKITKIRYKLISYNKLELSFNNQYIHSCLSFLLPHFPFIFNTTLIVAGM